MIPRPENQCYGLLGRLIVGEFCREFLLHNTKKFQLNRQRKSLAPAFSHAAIRKLMPIYYDCAYKVSINIYVLPYVLN